MEPKDMPNRRLRRPAQEYAGEPDEFHPQAAAQRRGSMLDNLDPIAALEEAVELLKREARLDGIAPNRFNTLTDPLLEVLELDPIEAMEYDEVVALITQLLSHVGEEDGVRSSEDMLQVYLDTLRTMVKELRH